METMWLEFLESLGLWLINVKNAIMSLFREEYCVVGSTSDVQCGIPYENEMIRALDCRNLTVNPAYQQGGKPSDGVKVLSVGKC